MHHPVDQLVSQLLNGLQLGSLYALIALGYTMVYGVLKLINFAHGDVYMVGAYAGLGSVFVFSHVHHMVPSPGGAVLVLFGSMAISAAVGLIIEMAAYRPLRRRTWIAPTIVIGGIAGFIAWNIASDMDRTPVSCYAIAAVAFVAVGFLLWSAARRRNLTGGTRLTALITAIGVSLLIENFCVLPQVFSADLRFSKTIVEYPQNTSLGPLVVNIDTLVVFAVSLFLMALLTYVVTKTKVGMAIRAVSFDAEAAALMGIKTDRIIALTFALGSALAGAAGLMVPDVTHSSFSPTSGIIIGLKAFVAAVLGGIGNIPGALIGGLVMGIAETMVVAYGPTIGISTSYRDAVAFFVLILVLIFRPAGILGRFVPEKV